MQSAIPVKGMAMKLVDLISTLDLVPAFDGDADINGIAIDSRNVEAGDLFVALRGTAADGHDFVEAAVARGATAVVAEEPLAGIPVPVVTVPDSAKALAGIAARFNGDPASRMVLCGVTGTNGKSTTAILTRAIVNASRVGKMGLIGTLGWGSDDLREATHTTPDALTLHRLFAEMESTGVFGVVMEVSSHAVRQHRVWGLDFEVGVITNVTHDHLDYHSNYDDYRGAKAEFCRSLTVGRSKQDGSLIYWRDDSESRAIGEEFSGRRVSVGLSDDADVYAFDVQSDLDGTRMTLHLQTGDEVDVSTGLLGSFVAVNSALAAAAAIELGVDAGAVRAGLEAIRHIPGRFEAIGGGKKPTVVIDYAHTADSMEQVLMTCRALGAQRVITVFGCGGDRDRAKRPRMGEIATRLSERCYITTDNPRTEDVDGIIREILAGVGAGVDDRSRVVIELDRARAIDAAVAHARPGDVVALLGKGHENYQIIGTEKIAFSDRETAEGALRKWSAR